MTEKNAIQIGLKLLLFRRKHGITQVEIAATLWPGEKKNATLGRRIGYIESGDREITEDETTLLEKAYPEFKTFQFPDLGLADVQGLIRGYNAETFLEQQKRFMEVEGEACHKVDLWFFNGPLQPVLKRHAYRKSWAENLSAGSDYVLMWDLVGVGSSAFDSFRSFLGIATEIAQAAKSIATRPNPPGKIFVFPYVLSLDAWTPSLDRELQQMRAGLPPDSSIRIKRPFYLWPTDASRSGAVRSIVSADSSAIALLVSCYQMTASTVLYLPKRPSFKDPHAAVEFPSVLLDFGNIEENHEGRHLLVSVANARAMAFLVRNFEEWAGAHLDENEIQDLKNSDKNKKITPSKG